MGRRGNRMRIFVILPAAYRDGHGFAPWSDCPGTRVVLPRSVGGSELVVRELDRLLSDRWACPDLFALVDGESRRPGSWLEGRPVSTSFIQRLPWG